MAEKSNPEGVAPDETVAQLTPPPTRREVRFGSMRGRIRLLPGWDAPIDLDRFLDGEI